MDELDDTTGRLLLDSNIWIKEVGLMSKRASTLRLYMKESRKRLVVPEAVQAEAARHLASWMHKETAAARKAHEHLVRMFGTLSEWRIPSDEEVEERAERLARGVDVPADYIELQPDTVLRGARRCIAQRPPAHLKRKGDFVDCLIWEEVTNLLDSQDLCFVTNDGGFFDGSVDSNKLHRSLEVEAEARAHALRVERDLEPILNEFRSEFTIDTGVLLDFVNARSVAIKGAAESMGFESTGPPEVTYKAFATENVREVEVRFKSVQPFVDALERGWSTDGLRIEAHGLYGTETHRLEDVSMDREGLTYVDDTGSPKGVPGSTVYAYFETLYVGPRPITSDRRDILVDERGFVNFDVLSRRDRRN